MPYKIMMSIVCIVPLIFSLAFVAIPEFFVDLLFRILETVPKITDSYFFWYSLKLSE